MPKLRRRGGDGGPRRAPPARAGEARAVAKGERRRASRTPSPFFCSLPFSLSLRRAAVEHCLAREEAGEQRPEPAPRHIVTCQTAATAPHLACLRPIRKGSGLFAVAAAAKKKGIGRRYVVYRAFYRHRCGQPEQMSHRRSRRAMRICAP